MNIVEKIFLVISIGLLGVGVIITIRAIYSYYHPAVLTSFPLPAIILGNLALIGFGEICLFLLYLLLDHLGIC